MNAVFRIVTRIQDQDDFSGSLTDGRFLKYNSSTNKFELDSNPTTLAGYGITDAYPLSSNPAGYLTSVTNITGNAGTVTTINGRITAGTNISIAGSGTAVSPYEISASGGGIASINGDTTSAQLLTVGTSGTNFVIDSTTTPGTSVFNLPDASATARGLVTTGTQTIAGAKTFSSDVVSSGFKNSSGSGGLFFQSAYTTLRDFSGNNVFAVHITAGTPVCSTNGFGIGANYYTPDAILARDDANILAQRNLTNAQTFRVYNTYTSSTSFETLQFKANVGASYQIGSAIGSAGGTSRSTDIGVWNAAGTFTSAFIAAADNVSGYVSVANNATAVQSNGDVQIRANTGGNGVYFGTNSGGSYFYGGCRTLRVNTGGFTILQPVLTTSAFASILTTSLGAHTNLTASTEATDVNFNLDRTVQFATGALTTQRAMRIQAPTYGFVGASTITTASTLSISGAPVAGTNATITNAYALNVEAGSSYFASDITIASGNIRGGGSGGEYVILRDSAGSPSMYFRRSGVTWYQYDGGGNILIAGSTSAGGPCVFYKPIAGDSGILNIQSTTVAQTLRIFNTYTSATNNEFLQIRGVASNNFEIGPQNGSAGGTLRGLTIGGYTAGSGTITPWLTFDNAGAMTAAAATLYGPATWTIASDVASGSATLNLVAGKSGNVSGTQTINLLINTTSAITATGVGTYINGIGNGGVALLTGSVTRLSVATVTGNIAIANAATSSGSQTGFSFTGAAHTGQTASTEATMVNWNLGQTVTFATGALTTQRAMRIQAPTYGFVGASTITTASTLSISGPPIAGTNATITNAYALNVESGGIVADWFCPNGVGNPGTWSKIYHSGVGTQGMTIRTYGQDIAGFNGQLLSVILPTNISLGFSTTPYNTPLARLYGDGTGIISQRVGTAAQTFRVHGTYTSGTNLELIQVRGVAAANFEIGVMKGSVGGTARGLTIGTYANESAAITPWLTFDSVGVALFAGRLCADYSQGLHFYYAGSTVGSLTVNSGAMSVVANGITCGSFYYGLSLGSSHKIQWASAAGNPQAFSTYDIGLIRNAAGVLEINNGTAGTFRDLKLRDIVASGQITETPPSSVTLATNGQFSIEMTSDTVGNLVYRGSDGVTRRMGMGFDASTFSYLPLIGGTLTQSVSTTGSPTVFAITGGAHTTLTASTEATDIDFNLARTVQFATGALTTQRAFIIQAPTYGFVGASTITTASTLSISGPPVAGTNATITNAYALNVESGTSNFGGAVTIASSLTIAGEIVIPFWEATLTEVTSSYVYMGGEPTSGWKINRYDNSGVKTSATVVNNGGYVTLAAAWTDRVSLTYA